MLSTYVSLYKKCCYFHCDVEMMRIKNHSMLLTEVVSTIKELPTGEFTGGGHYAQAMCYKKYPTPTLLFSVAKHFLAQKM